MKTEKTFRCDLCLNLSKKTKIKTLFLISYFNLLKKKKKKQNKKRNGTFRYANLLKEISCETSYHLLLRNYSKSLQKDHTTLMMQHQIFIKIYLFKRNETNISKRYLICSNLLIKITQQCRWQNYGVVIINFLLCSPCILLFMLNNITYTKTEIKAQHRTSQSNLWGILQELKISYLSKTSLNGYFKLASDISPKSVA